jgi:hypothetical protein
MTLFTMMVSQAALAALMAELEELELRERSLSEQRRRLHDRLDRFPSEAMEVEERKVSKERRELHRRIDGLRARLRPELDHRAGQSRSRL